MKRDIVIGGRPIGADHPPYIIAELSANHLGGLARAFAIMEEAKRAGADAVKLQTYTADTITIDHDGPGFVLQDGLWHGRKLYDLYREAHMPWDWHAALFARGRELDLAVFSTPFDATAVDFLQSLDAPAYKIASFEAVDLALITRAAATGRPLIMSTGMVDRDEIAAAIGAARTAGANDIVLLHCVSSYPARIEDSNLRTIPDMARSFDVHVGLSDHTLGTSVAVAASALGACIIEKHVTLRRADGGTDSAFSLEPEELQRLVRETREAHAALGRVGYKSEASATALHDLRRSLYVVADMAAGERFSASNIRSIRPGYGLAPRHLEEIIGRRAQAPIRRGTPLGWELIDTGKDG